MDFRANGIEEKEKEDRSQEFENALAKSAFDFIYSAYKSKYGLALMQHILEPQFSTLFDMNNFSCHPF